MKPEVVTRAELLLGSPAEAWARIVSRGWSLDEHWTVVLADGTRAFLKEGRIDPSPAWIRQERRVYEAVEGLFMPRFLAFEDGERPLLALEDLMPARCPPPWQPGDVEAVLSALAEVAAAPLAAPLPRLVDDPWPSWHDVARDPAPFLGLGLASPAWLERSLPVLLAASERAPLDGTSLLHCDVRSDNVCVRDGRAVLLDWNRARVGNPAVDVAFWLPSLALEHGLPPDDFDVDELAVVVAGLLAARAGLPLPEGGPRVRALQRAQLDVALPWACRALDLTLE